MRKQDGVNYQETKNKNFVIISNPYLSTFTNI